MDKVGKPQLNEHFLFNVVPALTPGGETRRSGAASKFIRWRTPYAIQVPCVSNETYHGKRLIFTSLATW
jgi:hypothetical protein